MSDEDYCYIHGYEPIPETYYGVCIECRHVYTTADELIANDMAMRKHCGIETPTPEDAADIRTCPLCAHDF